MLLKLCSGVVSGLHWAERQIGFGQLLSRRDSMLGDDDLGQVGLRRGRLLAVQRILRHLRGNETQRDCQ